MSKPALLVLAAGMGSRYGGLKQIDPVGPGGETVLDYSVFDALRAGFGRVVFLIRRDIEEPFRAAVGSHYEKKGVPIAYAFQELSMVPGGFAIPPDRKKPWGTGHAILCSESALSEPFAVVNADDFYGADSYRTLAAFLSQPSPAADRESYSMVGFQLRNTLSEHGTVARGVCEVDADSRLVGVEELTKIEKTADGALNRYPDGSVRKLSGDEAVSMNMWGFRPSIFGHLRSQFAGFLTERGQDAKAEFFIPDVVNTLIQSGQADVTVLRSSSSWFGVTYREDKPRVEAAIRELAKQGLYPEKL